MNDGVAAEEKSQTRDWIVGEWKIDFLARYPSPSLDPVSQKLLLI